VVQKRATLAILSAKLAPVRFIPQRGGLLLIGPPGAGKSHIALGLTLAAIQAGHTALYHSAFGLAQDLPEAQPTGARRELIGCLCRVNHLAIEGLGMRPLGAHRCSEPTRGVHPQLQAGRHHPHREPPPSRIGARSSGIRLSPALSSAASPLQGRSYGMYDRRQRGGGASPYGP
jgi:hypothetical protein